MTEEEIKTWDQLALEAATLTRALWQHDTEEVRNTAGLIRTLAEHIQLIERREQQP